jgi:hypothetical protein
MYPARTSEPDMEELGGEPLEGSGFENENPATGFESQETFAEEGFDQ